jgi:hypothetical protein
MGIFRNWFEQTIQASLKRNKYLSQESVPLGSGWVAAVPRRTEPDLSLNGVDGRVSIPRLHHHPVAHGREYARVPAFPRGCDMLQKDEAFVILFFFKKAPSRER